MEMVECHVRIENIVLPTLILVQSYTIVRKPARLFRPENFPGKWRGRTIWSGYGSMVTNNVMLSFSR